MISRRTVLKSLAAAAAVPYLGLKPAAAITKPEPSTLIKSTWGFTNGDEEWLWDLNSFNAVQFWAQPQDPDSRIPDNACYGFEIQTQRWDNQWHFDLIDQVAADADPKLQWIGFNIEVEQIQNRRRREPVYEYVRQKLPNVPLIGGPVAGWAFNSNSLPLDGYDILTTFYNINYLDRFGADFAWILACHLYSEMPMWLCPNPVHEFSFEIIRPEEYVDACEVCEFSDWGVGMWSHDKVYNSTNLAARQTVLQSFANIQQRSVPPKDKCVLIPYRVTRRRSQWRELRALARMIWDAGYIPYAVDEGFERDEHEDARFFDWERVEPLVSDPDDYRQWRIWLHDFGHPSRPNDNDLIREKVRSYERGAADEIDAILTADGLCEKVR